MDIEPGNPCWRVTVALFRRHSQPSQDLSPAKRLAGSCFRCAAFGVWLPKYDMNIR